MAYINNDDEREMMLSALDISDEMKFACEALCRLMNSDGQGPDHCEPRYVISVASRMVGIEAHRLRHYERLGFVRPGRTDGRTRLYSQEDVDQLCCVKTLMNDLGLNTAGVQFALALLQQMGELQRQVTTMSEKMSRLERRRRAGRGDGGLEEGEV